MKGVIDVMNKKTERYYTYEEYRREIYPISLKDLLATANLQECDQSGECVDENEIS